MSKSIWLRIIIVAAVLIAAAVIAYPKIMKVEPSRTEQSQESSSGTPGQQQLKQALRSGKPTMIFFHSTTCLPCKEMAQIVGELKPDVAQRINIIDVLVDDPNEEEFIQEFAINSIPTNVFFDHTGANKGKMIGVIKRDKLLEIFASLENS